MSARALLGCILIGCSSSISASYDDVRDASARLDLAPSEDAGAWFDAQTDDTSATSDAQTDAPQDAAISCNVAAFRACLSRNEECGPCGRCFSWTGLAGRVAVPGERLCVAGTDQCDFGALTSTACSVGTVCAGNYWSNSILAVPCIDVAHCLEYERRYYTQHRNIDVADPHCWYSDGTRARTGRLSPARCVQTPYQSCGLGCECAAGTRCTWFSEVTPTGLCIPPIERSRWSRCGYIFGSSWTCNEDELCVQPIRGTTDGVSDALNNRAINRWREGRCFPRAACLAIQRDFGGTFRCLTQQDQRS